MAAVPLDALVRNCVQHHAQLAVGLRHPSFTFAVLPKARLLPAGPPQQPLSRPNTGRRIDQVTTDAVTILPGSLAATQSHVARSWRVAKITYSGGLAGSAHTKTGRRQE